MRALCSFLSVLVVLALALGPASETFAMSKADPIGVSADCDDCGCKGNKGEAKCLPRVACAAGVSAFVPIEDLGTIARYDLGAALHGREESKLTGLAPGLPLRPPKT